MAALSQLSYSPFEIEVVSKGNACLLAVTGGREAKTERPLTRDRADRDQKASIEFVTVDADRVDLVRRVDGAHVPLGVHREVNNWTLITSRRSLIRPHLHCTRHRRPPISRAKS
jgi:hypothetical protein